MLNKGTRIKVLAEGATTPEIRLIAGLTPEVLHNEVMGILEKKFVIHSVSIMPRSSVWFGYASWPYRAEIDLTTRVSYAQPDDAASIVANAFYQSAGALPSACVDGYGPCAIRPAVDPSQEPPSEFSKWAVWIVIALVAVTATGVFVAKRG